MQATATRFLSALSISLVVSCSSQPNQEQPASSVSPLTVPGLFFQGNNFSGAERGFGSAIEEKWGPALPGVEGETHSWPTPSEHTLPDGMNIVRLPFQWERLQPTLNQEFDASYLAKLRSTAGAWRDEGATVLLDVHNYAHYKRDGRGTTQPGQLIGSAEVPITAFADLWRRLALEFGSASASSPFIFGLMNEPHDISVATWVEAAQAALNAIRAAGANNMVFVPGADWTTAADFSWSKNSTLLPMVSDPNDNFAIEVHQYHNGACPPNAFVDKLQAFEAWAVAHQRVAFLGEFDLTDDSAACHEALANMLAHLHARAAGTSDGLWVGYTYWEGMGISNALSDLQVHTPKTCANAQKDGTETDLDCGGNCLRCQDQKVCTHDYDCQSGFCAGGMCSSTVNGGAGGSAGATGTSGAASMGGSSGGTSNTSAGAGMGGASSGAGGGGSASQPTSGGTVTSAGFANSSGSPGDGAGPPATEQSGCSYRTVGREGGSSVPYSAAVIGLLLWRSRRRAAR